MESERQKKLAKAEKLRVRSSFPFSLFHSIDYIESGELFTEVAKECEDLKEKVSFYKEAAATFMKKGGEYGTFRASECYKKIFDALHQHDLMTAIEYNNKYCECNAKLEKYMFAGQGYVKAGDLLATADKEMAVEMYKKAQEMYQRDHNCPIHYKEAVQKCLVVQLTIPDVQGAVESLGVLNIEHAKLCRQLLAIHLGKVDLEEDLTKEEGDLVMTLLNKEKETAIQALQTFRDNNVMMPVVSKIFDFVIERFQPENDIC